MNKYIIYLFILLFYIGSILCIRIGLIYFDDGFNDEYISNLVEEYNKYAEENDLKITLEKDNYVYTTSEQYSETLYFLLESRSTKYDLIFIDIVDSNLFSEYLEDLEKYLSPSLIDEYKNGVLKDIKINNNKLVSLPLYIEYNMLFSNNDLLKKHNKEIPSTWSNLLDTANYIVTEEGKHGKEIIGYSVDMTDSEDGFTSFYEYIYSYRNNTKDPYPDLTGPEASEAMIKLKELKNILGTQGIRSSSLDIIKNLNSPDSLFIKGRNNMKHGDNFVLSILPGKNEGISGSCIGGYNIGINRYISDYRKKQSAQILNYILSSEFQRKINMERGYQSGLKEFYIDGEYCQQYPQCQSLKMSQLLMKPINATNNYRTYSSKFRNYLSKYLYRDSNLEECLFKITQLTKIYYQENSSITNKIILLVIVVSYIFMIISYCLAFTKKHIYKFRLLNRFYWFIYILGLSFMMSYGFTAIGMLNDIKCKIRPLLISVGFTLSNTLLLIRMIINFPESNRRFVRFCENHFGLSVLIAISIDIILNICLLFNSYEVYIKTDGDLLYNSCEIKSFKGHMFLGYIYIYKIFIILSLYIVTFLEWNLQEFKQDVHYMAGILFITSIIYIIYGTISLIKVKGLAQEFIIPTVITYIYGFSNFLIYFFTRFFFEKEEENEKINIRKSRYIAGSKMELTKKYSSSTSLNQTGSNGSGGGRRMSIAERFISMHNYGEEIRKSNDLIKTSNYSSMTSLSGSHLNIMKKISTSAVNINNNNNNNEERDMFNRRTSQIISIPENRVADYSTSRISEKSQSTENSCENNNNNNNNSNSNSNINNYSRSRTRSYENFLPNIHRVTRMNSGPTKRSNTHLEKKNSSVSFSQIQPINASSTVSRISSKSSMTQSNENISKISSQKVNSLSSFSSDKINSYTKSNEIVSVEIQEISSNEQSEITSNKTDQ